MKVGLLKAQQCEEKKPNRKTNADQKDMDMKAAGTINNQAMIDE